MAVLRIESERDEILNFITEHYIPFKYLNFVPYYKITIKCIPDTVYEKTCISCLHILDNMFLND